MDATTLTGKTFNFKITTKEVCKTPTFTVPAAQSTKAYLYVGRTMSVAWPAWTPSPSFCPHIYVVDATTNGGLGTSYDKFTVDVTSSKRTIAIKAATSFASGDKKEYTIPITAKYPNAEGTLVAGKSYSFKFTLADDPCIASTPTQKLLDTSKTATWECTLLGDKDCTHVVALKWDPAGCDGTHTYTLKYGTGQAGDKLYDLSVAGTLTYTADTKTLTAKTSIATSNAGTYTIEVTATTSNSKSVANQKQTITVKLIDPCQKAKTTFAAVATQTYKLGDASKTFTYKKPTITPTACNSGEIAWESDYKTTIPSAITALVTKAAAVSDTVTMTIAKAETTDTKYVGSHTITVQASDETTKLDTALSITLKITDECETATVTKPKLADVSWKQGGTKREITLAKWETTPKTCKDRMLYKVTIPTAAAKLITYKDMKITLDGTDTNKNATAAHEITVQIQGPAGTDIASGSVKFKATVLAKAVAVVATNTTTTVVKKPAASKLGAGGKGVLDAVQVAIAGANAALQGANNARIASGARQPVRRGGGASPARRPAGPSASGGRAAGGTRPGAGPAGGSGGASTSGGKAPGGG